MASLLDFFVQNGRLPAGAELLRERSRMRGLLEGGAPAEGPTIFNPNAGGGASVRELQGTAQLMGERQTNPAGVSPPTGAQPTAPQQGPQPTAVNTPQGPQDLKAMQRNQRAGQLAQEVMRTTGRELTSGQRQWVEETAEDEARGTGPGLPGLGAFARIVTGQLPPAMTEAEKKRVRSNTLITAGLASMQSDQRGLMRLVEGLGYGRLYSQGVAQSWYSAAEDAGEELNRREALQDAQQLYEGFKTEDRTDLEAWQQVRSEARERGMEDVLDLATKEIEFLSDLPAGTAEREVKIVDGQPFAFDSEGQAYDMEGNKVGNAAFSSEAARERPIKRTFQRRDGTTVEALADPYTGEIVPGSEMVTERPGEGEDEDTVFQRTNALADDFRQETRDVQETLALAESAPEAGDNSAGDLRLIFVFNKLIDPGSRITEGEVRAGKNLGGMNAQARGFIDRMAEGRLPGPAREELMQEIEQMREARTQQLGEIAQQYEERARTFGVRPDFVVRRGLIPELGGDTSGGGSAGTAGSASDVDAIIEQTFGGGN